MKCLLTIFILLVSLEARSQIETGTVIYVYFSQNEVTVAADSRVIASDASQSDKGCKISTFGSRFAFTMAGIAHKTQGTTAAWNAHTVARRMWEQESKRHAADATDLALATERAWTKEMKVIYSNPSIIQFARQRMKPGDEPVLATAAFIATDPSGKLVVHGKGIGFDLGLYDTQGKISIREDQGFDLAQNSHLTGGHDEIINEFLNKTSVRAKEYMAWFKPDINNLPAVQASTLATKMIELSILLHPKKEELGFPIDVIQMNRKTGLKVVSMKSNCPRQ